MQITIEHKWRVKKMPKRIDISFEIGEMTEADEELLTRTRETNAVSAQIAHALMTTKVKNPKILVAKMGKAKGRSLSSTVNAVLKREKSDLRVIYRENEESGFLAVQTSE
jgi:alanyl-tRNA synthetase